MSGFIKSPSSIKARGEMSKVIEEFVGLVNTGTAGVSIARMKSPCGWSEDGQTPEFDEYTIVLRGSLQVRTRDAVFTVNAGQAFIAVKGEWVQYGSPAAEGAEYVSVCIPAFAAALAHPDGENVVD
jgi:quercetin dioxygenase-like cupin family protein